MLHYDSLCGYYLSKAHGKEESDRGKRGGEGMVTMEDGEDSEIYPSTGM